VLLTRLQILQELSDDVTAPVDKYTGAARFTGRTRAGRKSRDNLSKTSALRKPIKTRLFCLVMSFSACRSVSIQDTLWKVPR
jgi:hypothetical protein